MKTEILNWVGEWRDVLNACRNTVNKKFLDKEPSDAFKTGILIAEHSPIRLRSIRWRWLELPSWVATHFSRHKFECFIRTQRSDRTGIDRNKLPQDNPVEFMGDANMQSLIDVSRKRLCFQASPETRHAWEELVENIGKTEPEVELCCVPNCVYRCGCPELTPCGRWNKFLKFAQDMQIDVASLSIEERYKLWQTYLHPTDDSQKSYNAYKNVLINRVV